MGKFRKTRNKVIELLRSAKANYFNKICQDIKENKFSSKDWWKLINKISGFTHNPKDINVISTDKDTLIYDNTEKANILNEFFCSQSTIDDSNNQLPSTQSFPDTILSNINITEEDIKDAIKCLKIDKASGPDKISPRMIKEGCNELCIPFCMLFNLSLKEKIFPDQWKIANIIPVFKKNDPKMVSNYRPIALLSVISKIFEKCIYKYIYNHTVSNSILSNHQSGFQKGDSTVNQLLYLANELSIALDEGKEVRLVFFDISKAFDRVWHKGLLFKLKNVGITGNLLEWVGSYLFQRKQKVVLNGQESLILDINAGVPQGSILGPLFFLIYINDIIFEVNCSIKLFADDTTIYVTIENPQTGAEILNRNLEKISNWSKQWIVNFNPQKTETLLVSRKLIKTNHPTLFMDNNQILEVDRHKHLGLTFNNTCHWGDHIESIIDKTTPKLNILRKLKFNLDRKTLQTLYFSYIRPSLEYADIIFDNCPYYLKDKLEKLNIEAGRIVTGATKLVSINSLYRETGWETLQQRRNNHKLIQYFKIVNGLTPEHLNEILPHQHTDIHNYNTRNAHNYTYTTSRTAHHYNSFIPSTTRLWNELPNEIKQSDSLNIFKKKLSVNSKIPKYYFEGSRMGQILHARLRMTCSSLKQHLFLKNIEDNPHCTCGEIETTSHFLLDCQKYSHERLAFNEINFPITCELLLFGDDNLSYDTNVQIFAIVQDFIIKTKRFI